MKTRNRYTNAVDLWAFGVLVHEVLTSEIRFLETYHDLDTDQTTDGTTYAGDMEPIIDSQLLFSYCNGAEPFPIESLQRNRVNKKGIDFVTSLMVFKPGSRVSATQALNSPWLVGVDLSDSNLPPTGIELLGIQFQLLGVRLSAKDADLLFTEENRAVISATLKPTGIKSTCIRTAVSMGYVEVVKVLLKVYGYIDLVAEDASLLQLAAREGQVAVMRLLLNRGGRVSVPASERGWKALQAAAWSGHLEAVVLLLDNGAYPNAPRGKYGSTALRAAAMGGHLDVVRLLLDRGAFVNGGPERSALQAASEGGYINIMKVLLDKGAQVNTGNWAGSSLTALQAAPKGGHIDAMKLLLRKGADVNAHARARGGTALAAAARGGHIEAMRLLLSNGAHVNQAGGWAMTPLQSAAQGGHLDALSLLLNRGADVNAPGELNRSPVRQSAGEGDFLASSADANEPRWVMTALQGAARGGHLDAMILLLDNGADVGLGIRDGITALPAAARGGHLDAIRVLLNWRASGDAQASEEVPTALARAAEGGHLSAMTLLLDKGAVIYESNSQSPLGMAAMGGHLHVVKFLLDMGIDVNGNVDDRSGTPLVCASKGGHLETIKYLLDHGAVVNPPQH